MRFAFTGIVLLCALALPSCGGAVGSSDKSVELISGAQPGHVVIVVEENKRFADVVDNPDMPFLNSLINQFGLAGSYFANGHPSIPNYFMLTTGKTITFDDGFTGVVSDDNIVRRLLAANLSWRYYGESLPFVGYTGGDQFPYVRHHNPFSFFSDVLNDSTQRKNLVPFTQFATDLNGGSLPNLSFVTPDQTNNTHDCPVGLVNCTLSQKLRNADTWLQTNIGPLVTNTLFQRDGLLLIVFDESVPEDTANGGGQVMMVLVGPKVKRGFLSVTFFQHESTLKMVLKQLGVNNFPGASAGAPDMGEFFTP